MNLNVGFFNSRQIRATKSVKMKTRNKSKASPPQIEPKMVTRRSSSAAREDATNRSSRSKVSPSAQRKKSPATKPKETKKTTTAEKPKRTIAAKPKAVERKRVQVGRNKAKVEKVTKQEKVQQPESLRECIERLNDTKYLTSLPFREDQVEEISEFIEECVSESRKWQVLLLSGSPGTGKTATVQRCIQMAPKVSEITFVNCKTDKVRMIESDEVRSQKILVLDEIESLSNFADVLMNCRKYQCSIIGISNSHDRTLAAVSQGQNDMKTMIFNSYTTSQLQEIMWERLGGKNEHIQPQVIEYLAKSIGKDKGDARGILSCLNYVLCEAVRSGMERLDLKTAVQFLKKRSDKEKSGIMADVTLIDQLALVAVIKGGKKWKETFMRYAKNKHISVSCSLDDIFDRLVSYGLVSDNPRNPCCIIDKGQLAEGLDESVSILL